MQAFASSCLQLLGEAANIFLSCEFSDFVFLPVSFSDFQSYIDQAFIRLLFFIFFGLNFPYASLFSKIFNDFFFFLSGLRYFL